MIRRWLIEQQPITSWEAALAFAQALRNVTVHGALSATKIKEWKLPATLETLLHNLEQVVAAALARLNEP
jgi:hypothetical protein